MDADAAGGKLLIEGLGDRHDRAGFNCGVAALDEYLRKQATQDARKHAAIPFVATPDGKTIAGYYTLSQYAVRLADIPENIAKKLPRYPVIPATLLGRLAVSTDFRGQGIGELLLMDAIYRALRTSREIASVAVVVDAKEEKAADFYRKYGFINLVESGGRLFLPMKTIARLFP